jgi:putative membrane protein
MNRNSLTWLVIFGVCLTWSAINPHDWITWWLEVLPAIIGLVLLATTRQKFPLTPLLYSLILLHCVILMVGGHYTYAEVPLGDWLQSVSGSERNNYDKLGHFAQGFIPAILAREILVRNRVVLSKRWLIYIILSIVLAFSAFYELLEWAAAVASAEGAEDFLGTQGYVWDTQSDMLWALCGAITALLLLSRLHNRQLSALDDPST